MKIGTKAVGPIGQVPQVISRQDSWNSAYFDLSTGARPGRSVSVIVVDECLIHQREEHIVWDRQDTGMYFVGQT